MSASGTRISKELFDHLGGLQNPLLYRRMVSGKWQYFTSR